MKNICIIPARGGSKRIPKKNIKLFHGKPLIAYSIENAKKSKLFQKIVVSTDDKEIAKIAKNFGAEVQIRPKKLSDDYTGSTEVFEYVISKNPGFEYACMLYPTTPLLTSEFLKKGLEELKKSNSCFSFGAVEFESSIFRGFEIINKKAKMLFPEYENKRTQDLPKVYRDAGAFYWKKTTCKEKFTFNNNLPIILPRWMAIDIDTIEDFEMAEKLYKAIYDNN